MKNLITSAALVGGGVTPTQGPYTPIMPDEVAKEAKRVEDAGAAIVHIHPRNPKTGEPTADTNVYREILCKIHHTTNLVICPTTGLGRGFTAQERMPIIPLVKPELASHDIGCLGGTRDPVLERIIEWKYDWEKSYWSAISMKFLPLLRRKSSRWLRRRSALSQNTSSSTWAGLNTLSYLKHRCNAFSTFPLWIQFVTGYFSKCPTSREQIIHMKHTADDLLGKDIYEWEVIGIGYPAQFQAATMAIIMGGHCRVGLENNLYMAKGVKAKSSAEQVERTMKIARELGREVAIPDEARQMLNLKGKDKVNL